ncbi:MAG: hypothetical protein Q7T57_02785 [Dehalococcoidales bacterium]|nr:hypothetical protein [Dehalococcoidales bacterium]
MATLREILESQVTIPASIESQMPALPKVSAQLLSFARSAPTVSLPSPPALPSAMMTIPKLPKIEQVFKGPLGMLPSLPTLPATTAILPTAPAKAPGLIFE